MSLEYFLKKNQVIRCESKLAAINSIIYRAAELRCTSDLAELNATVKVSFGSHDLNEQTK